MSYRWTLDRLKNVKEFEGNKQYVSEVLSILMQSSTINQVKLATMQGIDALLSCVFPYKGRNARSDGEEEYVANLFGCLCSCLMPAENKTKFMQVCCCCKLESDCRWQWHDMCICACDFLLAACMGSYLEATGPVASQLITSNRSVHIVPNKK